MYGSPNRQKRQLLWDNLRNTVFLGQFPWMAIGDFNAILASSEKTGSLTEGIRCPHFGDFVESANLHDLGFKEPPFTWHRGSLSVRLDRALGNGAWIQNFPNCRLIHLPKIKSDHRPILLVLNSSISQPRGRPFRFLPGWIEHPGFENFLKENWDSSGNFTETLGRFTHKLKEWNKNVYGNFTTRKRDLINRIACIQKRSNYHGTHHLNQIDLSLHQELENVLHHEELLWRQKAMCDWLKMGDRNTKYFHTRALQRRKNNHIHAIRDSDGNWIYDPKLIEREANVFFQRLYKDVPDPLGTLPPNRFPHLDPVDIGFLRKPVSNEEIKVALFDMAPLKALGNDGFHALFFQKHWDFIGGTVCDWIKRIFEGNPIEADMNNTLIVLIPKVQNPETFGQFWPISLCSVLYKLTMKVIANRFRYIFCKIIAQEQAGFIAGRSINDNIILAQEVIHSMRCQKRKKWMTIKIDLEKAYDRVSWEFIEASLRATGILDYLINVIMSSISTSTMQVMWNGVPLSKFSPARGIRQGKADLKHCRILKGILDRFCALSGHKVNANKTNIFFSKGVDEDTVVLISSLLGFQRVHNLGHYLGVLLLHQRITSSTLRFVVEKVHEKLNSWEAKKLSLAGRITLAHSILLSIPSYFMQSMMIPRNTCDEIEKIIKQFIWGFSERSKKMALVGWDTICQPKECGGLGLRNLRDQNISFLMKLGSKYRLKEEFPSCINTDRGSFLWKSLSKIWSLLRENLHWSVGNGHKVKCWQDNWIPEFGPLHRFIPADAKGIPPPSPSDGPNRISWNHTSSGRVLSNVERVRRVSRKIPHAIYVVITQKIFYTYYATVQQLKMFGFRFIQVYLFTDGAVQLDSGLAAAGGVVRDKERQWIMGFHRFIGKCSVFNAELWGILEGLKLIRRLGLDHVIIHSDSLEVVESILGSISTGSNSALIRRIHNLMSQENHWFMQYIPREQNQVADCLAKQALREKGDPQVLDDPPEIARALLGRNKYSVSSYD
ncbi:hypothetical protein PVK06_001517 [Gossypium arboreum]|uniref:RNase H type-1 domain-containing protein n=1 Tax=Gossypium arboreum TaxID=29729 RepID=A0ABR0R1H6_GOSAR|nr:hypothetical protein PVK06_001517 [Gossypium arboreum]